MSSTKTHENSNGQSCPFKHEGSDHPDYCPEKKLSSEQLMKYEYHYAAHNYHPLPVVLDRAEGVHVWDPEGKRYFDFLSAYSAVNQGHCHPKIIQAMIDQAKKCTLTSRAFYNAVLPRFAKYITEYFGYDMVLPMNSGAEAVETALKLARKWGYMKKGIPYPDAIIISASGCFHGRTLAIISMSSDPECQSKFGPFIPGVVSVEYNSVDSLKDVLEKYGSKVAGFLVEPIQGEAGVYVPDDSYILECFNLCKKHNVLFIADEIQTGLCRTGKLLACDWIGIKPDIVILGKALSGGTYPISCILADKDIMLCIKPGEHGSTYGGNPLAASIAITSLEVLKEEKLAERANEMGEMFRNGLREMKCPYVTTIRGKGLLNVIIIDENYEYSAWEICLLLKERGLLAKPTHENIIRLAPPLIITKEQIQESLGIIKGVLEDIGKMSHEDIFKLEPNLHD